MLNASYSIDKTSFEINEKYYFDKGSDAKVAAGASLENVEIDELVDLYKNNFRAFQQKVKKFAATVAINSIARRNTYGIEKFYTAISVCGPIGKQVCKDLLVSMAHACQESGKHEEFGKSFFKVSVKTVDGNKITTFKFQSVKNAVWNATLKWAKVHKSELLYERLPMPAKKSLTWLDRICSIAVTYETARTKALTGNENTKQAEQLAALRKQLDALPKEVKTQVLDALNTLSSVELPE